MDQSQEFTIEMTHKPKIFITTTGISQEEKNLLKKILPIYIILEDDLTTLTTYLVSYKAILSDKYIQAMIWNIKIVKIDWLYDLESSVHKHILKPLEGIEFASNEITNDIFINYFLLLGAVYSETLSISTGFFVSNDISDVKTEFCKRHSIPIIKPQDVFKNNFKTLQKPSKIEAIRTDCEDMFIKMCFVLDKKLDDKLFNLLKRLILKHNGSRVTTVDKNVSYIISNSTKDHLNSNCKVLHYQYIFDCVEYKAELYPNAYIIRKETSLNVLKNVVCCIESSLKRDSLQILNKLTALGSLIRDEENLTCTHKIIKDKNECKTSGIRPYKIVTVEWVDQCLYTLKHVREEKYMVKGSSLGLFALKTCNLLPNKVTYKKENIFQFTGLPTYLKNKAIEVLEKYNVKYIINERYEGCTHLIMGNLSTSEKFLSCISNGAWILTPEFIENFDNSINFDYEKYEWKTSEFTPEKEVKIINAIKKWRERVKKTGFPAFYKWKVKLYASDAKKQNFIRVIENGGGKVTTSNNFTHCFVAKNYDNPVKEKKFYSTDYLFAYLFR